LAISSGSTEINSDRNTGCTPDSIKSCTTLNTAGAVNSEPTGRSAIPADIWRKAITPVATAIAPAAIILPSEDGLMPGSKIFYRYPITIVFFTLPHVFNPLCQHNRRVMYDLLFEYSSQTLPEFGQNPKRLGAIIGFYGILHTWGGKMWPHPHAHYITTAGGIYKAGKWITPENDKTFLFPVKALSNVFRAKFLEGLQKAYNKGLLRLPGSLNYLADPNTFKQWLYHEVPKEWVVFSKPPFAGPEEVVKYIGRYTHRSAISNNRIIGGKDGNIEFWFKDTKKKARWETTSLPVMIFIERFLYHVLPKHFHRIRYYGFLANGKAKANISTIRQNLIDGSKETVQTKTTQDEGITCSKCKNGTMMTLLIIDGYGNVITDNLADKSDQPVALLADST